MRWKKHVAGMKKQEIRSAQKISARKPERKKQATEWSRFR
jgi:hypothetical protein